MTEIRPVKVVLSKTPHLEDCVSQGGFMRVALALSGTGRRLGRGWLTSPCGHVYTHIEGLVYDE